MILHVLIAPNPSKVAKISVLSVQLKGGEVSPPPPPHPSEYAVRSKVEIN